MNLKKIHQHIHSVCENMMDIISTGHFAPVLRAFTHNKFIMNSTFSQRHLAARSSIVITII